MSSQGKKIQSGEKNPKMPEQNASEVAKINILDFSQISQIMEPTDGKRCPEKCNNGCSFHMKLHPRNDIHRCKKDHCLDLSKCKKCYELRAFVNYFKFCKICDSCQGNGVV